MHNIPKPNNSSVSNSGPEEIYQKQINCVDTTNQTH